MHKSGLCRHTVSVRPPVRPSCSWILSKRINIIFYNFSPLGSHAILVFPYRTSWQYSDGDPITGASNAGRVGQKSRFSTNVWLLERWLVECEQLRVDTLSIVFINSVTSAFCNVKTLPWKCRRHWCLRVVNLPVGKQRIFNCQFAISQLSHFSDTN